MELERSLLKAFAEVVTETPDDSNNNQYVRGTTKVVGNKKYVKLDGSENLTPISETVDIQEGDRVLVSIENHRATILGNFTYPPSARKEQDALDKAENAQQESSSANQKAEDAITEAGKANTSANNALTHADEAIKKAEEAQNGALQAQQDIIQAKQDASDAKIEANKAHKVALEAQGAISDTRTEIDKINKDVETVQGNVNTALGDLQAQASEIKGIKETYSTKVETNNVKAELTTEITKKVGELQTTISKEYAAKSEITNLEGKLQTQITQNSEGLNSQAYKIEKLETDTTVAQQKVNEAKQLATQAQSAANEAVKKANNAQFSADSAKIKADDAQKKADEAEDKALQAAIDARVADQALTNAKTALDEAKRNYELIVNNPSSTPEQIQQAQEEVKIANDNVIKALEAAATASYAAKKAQEVATKAQNDATTAQGIAQEAQTKADNAKTIADKAQADAMKAQQDVAALTNRVTEAETNISQNAEQIALTASKTEEIGNELINNYYSKTETDAAIKVSSENVKLEVEKTYSSKSETISNTKEQFYLSDSPTSLLGGAWADSQPTRAEGKYIWRRTEITKGNGVVSYTPSENGVRMTEEINIGARNLLLKSDVVHNNANSPISIYEMSEDMIEGEVYTCRIWGELGSDKKDFALYLDGDSISLGYMVDKKNGSYILTFIGKKGAKVPNTINVYPMPKTGTKSSIITKIKLEKGNKPTDWTPAPEDTKADIDNAVNDSEATITEAYKSLIDQTSKSITQMVNKIEEVTNQHGTSISSLSNQLEITTEMAQFVKTTTEKLQSAVDGKLSAEEVKEWARFDGAKLELGASNSPFKCILSNTELAFYQGSSKVAWISNNELNILTAIIARSIGCGNFTFIDEGALGFSLL